jgi:hypothetical protein
MGAHILRCVAGLGQISAASDGRYSWEKERERVYDHGRFGGGAGGIISDGTSGDKRLEFGVACCGWCAHGSHRDPHIYSSCTPR